MDANLQRRIEVVRGLRDNTRSEIEADETGHYQTRLMAIWTQLDMVYMDLLELKRGEADESWPRG